MVFPSCLPNDLGKSYFFKVNRHSTRSLGGIAYTAYTGSAATDHIEDLGRWAQRGLAWVDSENSKSFTWKVKCTHGKCDCPGRPLSVYSVVVESMEDHVPGEIHDDYAMFEQDEREREAYILNSTQSRKQTYFFLNEVNRQKIFDFMASSQSPSALAAKASNQKTHDWLHFYEEHKNLTADRIYRGILSRQIPKNVCVPFIYIEIKGKRRRQDSRRYFMFNSPDDRMRVARSRSKRMFAAQSKGKPKKVFVAELLARLDRMDALWPGRIPDGAPFLETCLMLDFEAGICML